MRLTTVRVGGGMSAGRLEGDEVVLLPFGDVGELLAADGDWRELAAGDGVGSITAADAELALLCPRPEKIVCVGTNYRDHAAEIGLPIPDHPPLFAKYSRSLIGPRDDIVLPANSDAVDWEAELGVVIGTPIRNADPDQALAAVAGYTIVNDVSMRDWQLRTSQFLQGKTFEATTPVGPYLVTGEEIDDARDLQLTCTVDGQVMQQASTSQMIFTVAEIVAYLSQIITLVPGDLIATGTPAGIGAARQPPTYLTPQTTLKTTIAGLDTQTNTCKAPTTVAATS